jgi:hypothetical protein
MTTVSEPPTDQLLSDGALERLRKTIGDVRNALAARDATDRIRQVGAVEWSLCDAPEVGFALLETAGERFSACGTMQADDLVEDARLSFEEMKMSGQQSRFARESIIRYVHASGDLVAQVVNGALDDQLSERDCSLRRIAAKLRTVSGSERLALAVDALRESVAYLYLDAACNRLKHRSVLPGGVSAVAEANEQRVAVTHETGAFTHGDAEFEVSDDRDLRRRVDEMRSLVTKVLATMSALPTQQLETAQNPPRDTMTS